MITELTDFVSPGECNRSYVVGDHQEGSRSIGIEVEVATRAFVYGTRRKEVSSVCGFSLTILSDVAPILCCTRGQSVTLPPHADSFEGYFGGDVDFVIATSDYCVHARLVYLSCTAVVPLSFVKVDLGDASYVLWDRTVRRHR